jgi:hypothetical protein
MPPLRHSRHYLLFATLMMPHYWLFAAMPLLLRCRHYASLDDYYCFHYADSWLTFSYFHRHYFIFSHWLYCPPFSIILAFIFAMLPPPCCPPCPPTLAIAAALMSLDAATLFD